MKSKALALVLAMSTATANGQSLVQEYAKFQQAVNATQAMLASQETRKLVTDEKLDLVSFTWEDTGRSKNSSLGPNISDMSIQVQTVGKDGKITPVLMPVIRYPNFDDKTGDLDMEKFTLLVGNEKGQRLKPVTLREYLGNLRAYLSNPDSWKGDETSLLSPRDTKVLVSSQITFLPVPAKGKATFNPVLFNYQSDSDSPAVLAIVASREGTSATIIDNKGDGASMGSSGQRLFFNEKGQRASFTGERQKEFEAKGGDAKSQAGATVKADGQSGLNMVLLIQVPLKHKEPRMRPMMAKALGLESATRSVGIDNAVIGHGEIEGPFTEIANLKMERDHRFPVRVTVQLYKATDTPEISKTQIRDMKRELDRILDNASDVGSLVTGGKTSRPTEHNVKCNFPRWWGDIFPLQVNGKQFSIEKAKDLVLEKAPKMGWIYWCSIFKTPTPRPLPIAYALEMAETGKFEVAKKDQHLPDMKK